MATWLPISSRFCDPVLYEWVVVNPGVFTPLHLCAAFYQLNPGLFLFDKLIRD